MEFSPLLTQLIQSLRVLPGVGPKSAQRMALYLLQRERSGGQKLANALHAALTQIGYCQRCRNLSETPLCAICQSPRRHDQVLCIVESPADLLAIEQTHDYHGHYFVLHGHLSPLEGIGPEALGLDRLEAEIDAHTYQEIILATNPTVEGEASAHYIAELLRDRSLRFSRLAYGLPLGGELEYIDGGTLAHAFTGRLPFNDDYIADGVQ